MEMWISSHPVPRNIVYKPESYAIQSIMLLFVWNWLICLLQCKPYHKIWQALDGSSAVAIFSITLPDVSIACKMCSPNFMVVANLEWQVLTWLTTHNKNMHVIDSIMNIFRIMAKDAVWLPEHCRDNGKRVLHPEWQDVHCPCWGLNGGYGDEKR